MNLASLPIQTQLLNSLRAERLPHMSKLTFWKNVISNRSLAILNDAPSPRCWLTNVRLTKATADLMFLNLTGSPWGAEGTKVGEKLLQAVKPRRWVPNFIWVHEAVRPFLEAVMLGELYEGAHPEADNTADYFIRLANVRMRKLARAGLDSAPGEYDDPNLPPAKSRPVPENFKKAAQTPRPVQAEPAFPLPPTPPLCPLPSPPAGLLIRIPDEREIKGKDGLCNKERLKQNPPDAWEIITYYCKRPATKDDFDAMLSYLREYSAVKVPTLFALLEAFSDEDFLAAAKRRGWSHL